MSSESHEARIAVLEEWRRSHEELAVETRTELRLIKTLLQELTVKVAQQRLCPAPGECLKLSDRLKGLEDKVSGLEEQRNYWRGALVAVGAVVATVTSVIVSVLVGHLKH